MATVNQTPAALSLAGNLKPFKISSTESVQFRLLKGGVELLSQRYEPGADGVLEIDVKAVVFASLAYAINSANSYVQSAIAADFVGEVDGASFAFRAVRGGVANLADTDSNWLRNHFLTWQPKIKPVTYYSPEWLTYYGVQEATIKLLATFDGGATQTLTLASVAAGTAVTVNVQYSSIAGRLGNVYPTHYKVWAESTAGARLTDEQFYTYSEPLSDDEQWYLFENSLGGLDTFRAYGVNNFDGTHTHQIAEFGETYKEYDVEAERVYNKNTGYLNDYARVWMLDFFPSRDKYIYEYNAIRKIVVTDSDVKYVSSDLPSAYSFSYKFADKTRYLNLIRNESELPANLVVPNLDAPDFIFPPRLSELPRIQLTEGVLIPAFDASSPTATVTTFGEIKQVIVEAALAAIPSTGGPGTGTLVVLLPSTDDSTAPSDLTVFTSKRTMAEITKALTNVNGKYLRKDIEDTAEKKITFKKGLQIGESYVPGLTGEGGNIDEFGNAELDSLTLRKSLTVPDLQYNRVKIVVGDAWRAPGGGIIKTVDTVNKIITLKLEEGEYGEVAVGDKCMGIYHSFVPEENEANSLDDSRGNRTFAGFATSYFEVVEILESVHNSQFRYELRPISERWSKQVEPYEMMHFVAYSNPTDITRQMARYSTLTYERFLWKMTDWEIGADNIAGQIGDLTNLSVHGFAMSGYSAYLNNIYMTGTIQQFDLVKPMDIMYSSVLEPGNPTDNPDNWTTTSNLSTIWMAIRTIKNGQPSPWDIVYTRGTPGTPGDPGTRGQSVFKSTVFIRSNTVPGTPSGGNYDSPVPVTAGWSDGVPSGSAKLWMSTRIFTSDGLAPQQTAWMAPEALTDNSSLEVMFSAVATPGNPTANPSNWTTTGDANTIWMATRTITNGVASAWTIAKVKGESGADALTIVLSTDNIIVSCDSAGNPKTGQLGATGKTLFTVDVYRGTTKLTFGSEWQFYNTAYTNIVIGQISGTSTLFLSGITEDSGFGDFTVRIGSIYLTKRLNAKKAYDGATGLPGNPGVGGVSMMLVPETWPVMCDSSGVPLSGELTSSGKAITEIKVYLGGTLKTYGTDWQFLTSYGTNVTWGQISGQPKIYINSMSPEAKSGYVDINIQLLGVALTKRFSVSKVITGAQGLQGCIVRITQWAADVNYRNDSALTSGERYIDIVVHRISNVTRRFKAKAAHNGVTSSSSNQPDNSTYWEELNTLSPIYTPLILADYAVIEFFQGHEIKIMKTDGTVGAGVSGAGSGTTGVRFWAGGATPGEAPFRVYEDGSSYQKNMRAIGLITSPFKALLGNGNSTTFNYYFETLFSDGKCSNYYASPGISSNSRLNLPTSLDYAGATINVYVEATATYPLIIIPTYLINKTSYTIAKGQMVELVCIATETEFKGWYLKD